MPTPDRTTLKAAIQQLASLLRSNLTAEPPTAVKPFRRVEVGPSGTQEYPRPFLTLRLARSRPIGVTDNDKVFEVSMELRLVTDVTAADPHDTLLDAVGAIEDYLDGLIDTGVLDGAAGFDDRVWTFEYPKGTAGPRSAAAQATQTFIVKVQRGYNRLPAT